MKHILLSTLVVLLNIGVSQPADAQAQLSAVRAQDAAIDILLGDPYGETVDDVRRHIIRQDNDAVCGQIAWKFTVSVPKTKNTDAIQGHLCLDLVTGEIVAATLPFLD